MAEWEIGEALVASPDLTMARLVFAFRYQEQADTGDGIWDAGVPHRQAMTPVASNPRRMQTWDSRPWGRVRFASENGLGGTRHIDILWSGKSGLPRVSAQSVSSV